MCNQTFREQGFGAKEILASYDDRNWSLSTLQTICRRVDEIRLVQLWRIVQVAVGRSASAAEKIAREGQRLDLFKEKQAWHEHRNIWTVDEKPKGYAKFHSLFVNIRYATACSL